MTAATPKVATAPSFFITLAEPGCEPSKSEDVVRALHAAFQAENQPSDAHCAVLGDEEILLAYLNVNGAKSDQLVVIFDDWRVPNCFSPISWSHRSHLFPSWAQGAQWGIAIHRQLPKSRIQTVANQIRADFVTRFLERLGNGTMPWGNLPSGVKRPRKPGYRDKNRVSERPW